MTIVRKPWALVSMPWFWAYLPSIQLAIVKDELARVGISANVFEFYTDLVADTGIHLYKAIANDSGYVAELLFSQFWSDDRARRRHDDRPFLGLVNPEIEQDVFTFLTPVIERFLDRCFAETDWGAFEAVCFSLTASQTAASIALARRIRNAWPDLPIIFGGTSCAGEMGCAIAEICPAVNVVVHGEAESTVPGLARALVDKPTLADVPGISWRDGDTLRTNERAALHQLRRPRGPLDFDSYFARIEGNAVLSAHGAWVPFETSRGCWYGEKAQCTFCGLNEIIRYRERGGGGLLAELEHYERRYGARNFFAVDLIMPLSFFDGFLPEVEAAGKEWTIFYEIKANMRRAEIEQLARAGVRWIQPGIESLSDEVLRIMRKGVTAAHNIQTLRLTRELGVTASWNLITGFPRETAAAYREMAALFPRLHHLLPPVGLGDFEVHRFSPFFEEPEAHGIALEGAFPSYDHVYPVGRAMLDRLVYRFKYRLLDAPDAGIAAAHAETAAAIDAWRRAAARGASFTVEHDRRVAGAVLRDTRTSTEERVERLGVSEAALLAWLDELRPEAGAVARWAREAPHHYDALGGEDGVAATIQRWAEAGIVLRLGGQLLALPIPVAAASDRNATGKTRSEDDASGGYESAGGDARYHQGAAH